MVNLLALVLWILGVSSDSNFLNSKVKLSKSNKCLPLSPSINNPFGVILKFVIIFQESYFLSSFAGNLIASLYLIKLFFK